MLVKRHDEFNYKFGFFKNYTGDNIVKIEDGITYLEMKDRDITIKAEYDSLGALVPYDIDSCKGSQYVGNHTKPIQAIRPNVYGERWEGRIIDGSCWLEVSLKEPSVINSWYMEYDISMKTEKFTLEYKLGESQWQIADSFVIEKEANTARDFKSVTADKVRLVINSTEEKENNTAKIYYFQVYCK